MWTAKPLMVTALTSLFLLAGATAFRAEDYAVVKNVRGDGYVQGSSDEQTQSLAMNVPLMNGDNIWTGPSGQLDILMQDGNHLWVDYDSRIEVDQFPQAGPASGKGLVVRLWKGAMLLDVRGWNDQTANYVVTTPSASLSPSRPGVYYLQVQNVDRTKVTALDGSCLVASAGSTVALQAQQMTYTDYGYPPLQPMTAQPVDSTLVQYRDSNLPRPVQSVSQRYLPSDLYAYSSELDDYGSWSYTAPYGDVWYPSSLPSGWAPYTDGRWVWNPWGMTWVPYEAWGWAPFHYGRWVFNVGIGWGWVPGPYFAPAWVSFWWGDDGWLGWCPLGFDGYPIWGPAGWYSCPVGYIYQSNLRPVIVHHRTAPPPRPIYPRAPGNPGGLRGGSPRSRGSYTSINLPPRRVRAFRDGRITGRELGRQIAEPIRTTTRAFPSVQPAWRDTRPVRGGGGDRTAVPNQPRGRDWPAAPNRSWTDRTPRSPRTPVEGGVRNEPYVPRRVEPNRYVPRSVEPPVRETPRWDRQGVERPQRMEPFPQAPRLIPSRPPSGMSMPEPRISIPSAPPPGRSNRRR